MKLPGRKSVATAQPPVHKGVGHYGRPITLDQAKKAMAAAEAKARQNKWNVVISIVDSGDLVRGSAYAQTSNAKDKEFAKDVCNGEHDMNNYRRIIAHAGPTGP